MRFEVVEEYSLFGASMRGAVGGWEPEREPDLGAWLDDRDDALAARLAEAGWGDLADPDLRGAVVAGALELGRAVAPVCLIDEATLGAPLAVDGRARHTAGAALVASPRSGGGLVVASLAAEPVREVTLDGSGTVRVELAEERLCADVEAADRWGAWAAGTLAYLAGLGGQALALSVEHVRRREQFGAPLGSLPAVQGRLARASLAVDAMTLLAWAAAEPEAAFPVSELVWAAAACSEVTASAHQVHGAVGFALETGLHRLHRRARSLQSWTNAVCAALR